MRTTIESPMVQLLHETEPDNTFIASTTPIEDLARLSYAGQNPNRQLYRHGYERFFNAMPRISDHDLFFDEKRQAIIELMHDLKAQIIKDGWWKEIPQTPGDFVSRVIVAMERPFLGPDRQLQGGAELLVTRWTKGSVLPIHSHAAGFMYEEMLQGKWTETEYGTVASYPGRNMKVVKRLHSQTFVTGDVISDMYTPHNPKNKYPALIHSAVVEEETFVIHFIPSHPRDTRDNVGFVVEDSSPYALPMTSDADY